MIAYLDTNVLDYIAKESDARSVKEIFRSRRISVLASEFHLAESKAIADPSFRRKMVHTLTLLTDRFSDLPLPFRHAKELQFEIVRCRKSWCSHLSSTASAKQFIRHHRQAWKMATEGKLLSVGNCRYRDDSELGISINRHFQKFARSNLITAKKPKIVKGCWDEQGEITEISLCDPESYWRAECADVWYQAIVKKNSSCRDYNDYLTPHIVKNAFSDGTYASFWKHDVDGNKLPLNRLTGLASYYQLESKIGHGNSYDALHSNFGIDCELFLTADKAFFGVLSKLREHFGSNYANPILIDRGSTDVMVELEEKIDNVTKGST